MDKATGLTTSSGAAASVNHSEELKRELRDESNKNNILAGLKEAQLSDRWAAASCWPDGTAAARCHTFTGAALLLITLLCTTVQTLVDLNGSGSSRSVSDLSQGSTCKAKGLVS